MPVPSERTLVPSVRKCDLTGNHISKQGQVLIIRKPLLARKYFLVQDESSYFDTIFLNQDEVSHGRDEKSFHNLINFLVLRRIL